MKRLTDEEKEKKRIESKKYYKKYKEKIKKKNKEYYENNKGRAKEYYKEYSKGYFQKNKERITKHNKNYARDIRKRLIKLMGGKCSKPGCGFSDARALQVDHINGGGYEERKISSTNSFNRRVIRSVESGEGKFQLLCANCNWIKRYENNENRNRGKHPIVL